MKRLVIVGNGNIRGDHGAFIDRCDKVIRMNKFQVAGYEKKVGSKIDVYSTYPGCCVKNVGKASLSEDFGQIEEVWFPRPEEWCLCFPEYLSFIARYDHVPRFLMSLDLWQSVISRMDQKDLLTTRQELIRRWVKVDSDKSQIGPSTGFCTIEMALARFEDYEVFILGFAGEKDDWYWAKNPLPSSRHPWAWERRQVASYAESGLLTRLL